MAEPSLVSVVVPVHNGERYLDEALRSILGQTYAPIDLVVVDDGSQDGSVAVAAAHGTHLRLLRHCAPKGAAAARNLGASSARGVYLAFLDHDDLWLPDKLAAQVRALEESPELDMVFGGMESFLSPDATAEEARLEVPAPGPGLSLCAMLIRRHVFERIGPLREDLKAGEFIEWFDRARAAGARHTVLPRTVFRRRIHAAGLEAKRAARAAGYLSVVKEALKRKRS